MKLNPIVKRDITVGSRSMRLAVLIMAMNGLLLGVDILGIFGILSRYRLEQSVDLRQMLSVYFIAVLLVFFMVLILYPALSCGSIQGERNSGTMDLMLASGVSTLSITSGKYVAGLLPALVLLASFLPGMVLPVIFGGVRITSCFTMLLLFVPQGLELLSIGLYAGAKTKHGGMAALVAYGIVFGITFLPALLAVLLRNFVPAEGNVFAWLTVLSPLSPILGELGVQIGEEEILLYAIEWLKAYRGEALSGMLVLAGVAAELLFAVLFFALAVFAAGPSGRKRKPTAVAKELQSEEK